MPALSLACLLFQFCLFFLFFSILSQPPPRPPDARAAGLPVHFPGTGKLTSAQGDVFSGSFVEGLREGRGCERFADGSVYEVTAGDNELEDFSRSAGAFLGA